MRGDYAPGDRARVRDTRNTQALGIVGRVGTVTRVGRATMGLDVGDDHLYALFYDEVIRVTEDGGAAREARGQLGEPDGA